MGILLISAAYVQSSYCMEEARQLYGAYQEKKLYLLPVKLDDEPPPPFLASLQYERRRQRSPEEILDEGSPE